MTVKLQCLTVSSQQAKEFSIKRENKIKSMKLYTNLNLQLLFGAKSHFELGSSRTIVLCYNNNV